MKKRKECFGKHKIKGVLASINAQFENRIRGAEPRIKSLEIYPEKVTLEDYFLYTSTTFEHVTAGCPKCQVKRIWEKMKEDEDFQHHKSPKSDSEYLINEKTGDIYRYSDHWCNVASCYWELQTVEPMDENRFIIGKSNIRDFERLDIYIYREDYINNYVEAMKEKIKQVEALCSPGEDAYLNIFARKILLLERDRIIKSLTYEAGLCYPEPWKILRQYPNFYSLF